MKLERVENWWCGFEWCILNTEKLWSSNKFKEMKSLCNRRVSVWNPDTSKEIVRFIHEVHPVFVVTLSTFLHMLCGWNDDTMPTFNLFRVHLKCFSIWRAYSWKKISKCMKKNEVRKGWKLMMWLWMVHFEHRKTRISNKFKKMKSLCNTRVSVWYPDTSNEIVRFVHEVHPVFAINLSNC